MGRVPVQKASKTAGEELDFSFILFVFGNLNEIQRGINAKYFTYDIYITPI